jgi:hypothetical protein
VALLLRAGASHHALVDLVPADPMRGRQIEGAQNQGGEFWVSLKIVPEHRRRTATTFSDHKIAPHK